MRSKGRKLRQTAKQRPGKFQQNNFAEMLSKAGKRKKPAIDHDMVFVSCLIEKGMREPAKRHRLNFDDDE